MEHFLDSLLEAVVTARDFMWGQWMIALLVGAGIILTVATRAIQVRRLLASLRLIFARESRSGEGQGDISPFAALMTALAATVGNGNIAGVATAIATGGPGAAFWMWVSAAFGMATKYAEGFLGVRFRQVAPDGSMLGGPMYYARDAVRNPRLGAILGGAFALAGAVTALVGTGNMAQSNSMALAFKTQFGVPFLATAIGLTFLVGLVVIGGIKRIGEVSEKLVPTMIVFYVGGGLTIILSHLPEVPHAFGVILKSAFGFQAAAGAAVGLAVQRTISLGVSRGVLSNESGLGSAAIAQAASRSDDPAKNGLIAMTGTFIDTLVVNTFTTLAIVLTGAYQLTNAWRGPMEGNLTSTALTAHAFAAVLPFGGAIVAISSFLFGYTTLLGWAYYGEQCFKYLFGMRATMMYRWMFLALLFVGAVLQGRHLEIVWNVGDVFNALMALPNLLALILLAGYVARFTNDYCRDPEATLALMRQDHYLREFKGSR
jgi:AGCS family alanine or glycine:cation symporter